MDPAEFARACAAALTFLLVPGFAAASLIVPGWKWWERLALAPGLSTGLVGVVGLVLHDLGVPFSPMTVLPVLGALVMAGAVTLRRRRPPGSGPPSRSRELAAVLLAGAAGLVTVGIFVFAMRHQPLPIYDDPAVHAAVAEAIQRSHDTLPLIPTPVSHSGFVRPRSAIEATAALAGWTFRVPATQTLMPMGLVAALLVSLGLLQLVEQWTGSRAVSMVAPLLGLGMTFPTLPLLFGEYPLLVDSTLVAATIVAALRMMRDQDVVRHGIILFAAAASIWVGHGLETLTAVTIGAALVVRQVALGDGSRSRLSAARGLVLVLVCAGAGAAVVTLLTRLPAVPRPISLPAAGMPLSTRTLTPHGADPNVLGTLLSTLVLAMPSAPMLILFVAGSIYALVRVRLVGLVLTSLALVLVYYDVAGALRLAALWRKVYPWGVTDRVVGMQYWVLSIILAFGLLWLIRRARRLATEGAVSPARKVIGSLLVAATAAVGVWGGALALAADSADVTNRVTGLAKVTPADLAVFQAMGKRLPARATVLTDGSDDAGIWLNALTPQLAFETNDWLGDHPDDPHLVALEQACEQPQQALRALADADAVFIGSRRQAGATHPWRLDCISRLPGLRLVASARWGTETAAVFAVHRGSR